MFIFLSFSLKAFKKTSIFKEMSSKQIFKRKKQEESPSNCEKKIRLTRLSALLAEDRLFINFLSICLNFIYLYKFLRVNLRLRLIAKNSILPARQQSILNVIDADGVVVNLIGYGKEGEILDKLVLFSVNYKIINI